MSHSERQLEQLSAFVDGELPAAQRDALEAWLAQDEAARRAHDDFRRMKEWVRALPRESAPADLDERVAARRERAELLGLQREWQQARARGWRIALRGSAAAAVVVLAVGGAWYLRSAARPDVGRTVFESIREEPDASSAELVAAVNPTDSDEAGDQASPRRLTVICDSASDQAILAHRLRERAADEEWMDSLPPDVLVRGGRKPIVVRRCPAHASAGADSAESVFEVRGTADELCSMLNEFRLAPHSQGTVVEFAAGNECRQMSEWPACGEVIAALGPHAHSLRRATASTGRPPAARPDGYLSLVVSLRQRQDGDVSPPRRPGQP